MLPVKVCEYTVVLKTFFIEIHDCAYKSVFFTVVDAPRSIFGWNIHIQNGCLVSFPVLSCPLALNRGQQIACSPRSHVAFVQI